MLYNQVMRHKVSVEAQPNRQEASRKILLAVKMCALTHRGIAEQKMLCKEDVLLSIRICLYNHSNPSLTQVEGLCQDTDRETSWVRSDSGVVIWKVLGLGYNQEVQHPLHRESSPGVEFPNACN